MASKAEWGKPTVARTNGGHSKQVGYGVERAGD